METEKKQAARLQKALSRKGHESPRYVYNSETGETRKVVWTYKGWVVEETVTDEQPPAS